MTQRISTLIRKKLPFSLTISKNYVLLKFNLIYRKLIECTIDQGDVGSGKTLVALFAMILVAENRGQSALMVPTDILANQHFLAFIQYTKILELALFING